MPYVNQYQQPQQQQQQHRHQHGNNSNNNNDMNDSIHIITINISNNIEQQKDGIIVIGKRNSKSNSNNSNNGHLLNILTEQKPDGLCALPSVVRTTAPVPIDSGNT